MNFQDNQLTVKPMDSVERTHTIYVDYEPGVAARLFSAEGEICWVPGWTATLLKGDGFNKHDLFLNTQGTLFIVNEFDVDNGQIAYSRIAPSISAGTINITLKPEGKGSAVQVTYRLTALSEEGVESVKKMTEEGFREEMIEWEANIKNQKAAIDQWLIRHN